MSGPDAALRDQIEPLFLVVPVDVAIAASAARLRTCYTLKLPDAIQPVTALELGAAPLVTHDRDFARVQGLAILRSEPFS